jgi:hypothetical protein
MMPQATIGRALRWVGLSALASALIWFIRTWLGRGLWQWTNLIGAAVWVLAELALFGLIISVIHFLARRLGGTGTYREFLIASAAFYSPLSLLVGFLLGSAYVLPVLAYWIILHIAAIRAIYGLSKLKTLVAVTPLLLAFLLIFGAALAVIILALSRF